MPQDPVAHKNLGALHQHLMNHPPGGSASLQRHHMREMVRAYRGFLAAAARLGTSDPDREILLRWVTEVQAWMDANPEAGPPEAGRDSDAGEAGMR
mmetsp:Transcript_82816/g.222136  ORF Transcript_82816/g.222136 Transcript_82816/m.222136 type:complete len:96 (-) Transcript_82816:102-389(-)